MLVIVNLSRARRLKQGRRATLELIGINSDLHTVLTKAMAAADQEDRAMLLRALAQGTYSEMIQELVKQFNVPQLAQA